MTIMIIFEDNYCNNDDDDAKDSDCNDDDEDDQEDNDCNRWAIMLGFLIVLLQVQLLSMMLYNIQFTVQYKVSNSPHKAALNAVQKYDEHLHQYSKYDNN